MRGTLNLPECVAVAEETALAAYTPTQICISGHFVAPSLPMNTDSLLPIHTIVTKLGNRNVIILTSSSAVRSALN